MRLTARTGARGEFDLIEAVAGRFRAIPAPGVALGIGDDCAILDPPPGSELLVTTDLLLEGRHFRRDLHSAASAGHRCLARGLSDLAAMGGEPLAAFLSLALPAGAVSDRGGAAVAGWISQWHGGAGAGDGDAPGRGGHGAACHGGYGCGHRAGRARAAGHGDAAEPGPGGRRAVRDRGAGRGGGGASAVGGREGPAAAGAQPAALSGAPAGGRGGLAGAWGCAARSI